MRVVQVEGGLHVFVRLHCEFPAVHRTGLASHNCCSAGVHSSKLHSMQAAIVLCRCAAV